MYLRQVEELMPQKTFRVLQQINPFSRLLKCNKQNRTDLVSLNAIQPIEPSINGAKEPNSQQQFVIIGDIKKGHLQNKPFRHTNDNMTSVICFVSLNFLFKYSVNLLNYCAERSDVHFINCTLFQKKIFKCGSGPILASERFKTSEFR